MNYAEISMIILAGGQSSRMGTDKADLCLNGKTFLELQIEKGQALGITDIQVSGYRGKRCQIPITPDRYPKKGPLGGLESCLRQAKYDKCLVLGVDMPLVPTTELKNLIEKSKKSDRPVTILKHKEQEQPLLAVYDRRLADEMEAEITQRKGAVFAFINRIGYDVYESKAEDRYMLNVNSPDIFHVIAGEQKE